MTIRKQNCFCFVFSHVVLRFVVLRLYWYDNKGLEDRRSWWPPNINWNAACNVAIADLQMLSLALLFVLVLFFYSVRSAMWSSRLAKRELFCVLLVHLFVYFARVNVCPFSSSWCQGLAAACDCGTPWIFLLSLLLQNRNVSLQVPRNMYKHIQNPSDLPAASKQITPA